MNFDEAEQELMSFFKGLSIVDDANIAWPDQEFTVPDGETWVRFNSQESGGRQVSMGSPGANRFRQSGLVIIQVFQPQSQGSIDARAKAALIATAFKGAVTTNGLHVFDVFSRKVGNDENGFYQINVIASFYYDEIT